MNRARFLRTFSSPPALLTRPLSTPPTEHELLAAWAHVPVSRVVGLSTGRAVRCRGLPDQAMARRVAALRGLV